MEKRRVEREPRGVGGASGQKLVPRGAQPSLVAWEQALGYWDYFQNMDKATHLLGTDGYLGKYNQLHF